MTDSNEQTKAGVSTTPTTAAQSSGSDYAVKASVHALQVAAEAIRQRFPLGIVIQKS